jgi:hypothetical protein
MSDSSEVAASSAILRARRRLHEGHCYLVANHQRAIVPGGRWRQTVIMAGARHFWRNSERSEKLPLLVLCLCLVILVALVVLRFPF